MVQERHHRDQLLIIPVSQGCLPVPSGLADERHRARARGENCGDDLLRRAMAQAEIAVPAVVNLELEKYLNNRGEKKLMFRPELEIKDPLPSR